MITRKELGYVSIWASKVPYPGMAYAEQAMEKLKVALGHYNQFYNNKQYELILSNGEELSFEILNKNLCHLLGIDYKNLAGDYCENYRGEVLGFDYVSKSYELLCSIIDNADKVLQYDYEHGIRFINYYRVMIKCAIFEKLSDFSRFNFGVINFDKDTYIRNSGAAISANSSKFLYGTSGEMTAPYFMMGILKDANTMDDVSDSYVAETLIAPTNARDFFNEQEVVIPTQIMVITNDKMDKVNATAEEKIALLSQYRSIITQNNLPNRINIFGDYENMLSEEMHVKKRIK